MGESYIQRNAISLEIQGTIPSTNFVYCPVKFKVCLCSGTVNCCELRFACILKNGLIYLREMC